jgi:hypothetical protein
MENTTYQIIDSKTGNVIATYTYAQRNRARNRADRLDQQYGACRYVVKPVFTA